MTHQWPSLAFEPETYSAYLAHLDWDDQSKEALLQTLFNIAVEYAALGFGQHPVQQACGQDHQNRLKPAPSFDHLVNWSHSTATQPNADYRQKGRQECPSMQSNTILRNTPSSTQEFHPLHKPNEVTVSGHKKHDAENMR